jgi:hypothetical protein
MDVLDLDPTTMLVAGVGAAVIGSPGARRAVGRSVGRVAAGAWQVTKPVVMPIVDAGRDMAGEVRDSAAQHNGASQGDRTAARERAGRTRRAAGASA